MRDRRLVGQHLGWAVHALRVGNGAWRAPRRCVRGRVKLLASGAYDFADSDRAAAIFSEWTAAIPTLAAGALADDRGDSVVYDQLGAHPWSARRQLAGGF